MTYLEILSEAYQKGLIAMNECVPTPVGFCSADLVGNQTSPVEIVDEGECGGAYLSGISGRSRFVTWFKKNAEPQTSSHRWEIGKFSLSKGVYGGFTLSATTDYRGQSAERYEAFYTAFAEVIDEQVVPCFVKTYLT